MKNKFINFILILFLLNGCVGASSKGVFGTGVTVALDPRTLGTQIDDGIMDKNLDAKFSGSGVHVLKGGIVQFFQDIGWNMMQLAEMENPQREMFACFAEAMLLEFEGCHTNFSWGRNNITLEKMDFIGEASVRHGFSTLNLNPELQVAAA